MTQYIIKAYGLFIAMMKNTEYVTIEFAGNPNYYYLKDSQLYHSEREMINNNFGTKIQYLN